MTVASRLTPFLAELKRRKVTRVALVYLLVGIGVIEGAQLLFDAFEIPRIAWQIVVFLTVLGFPVALVLAWAYEVRPEGPREPESEQARAGPGPTPSIPPLVEPKESRPVVTAAVGGSEEVGAGTEEERPAIAVLPFDDFSPNPDDAYFANGMHEEILAQLQKIKGLAVRGRTSVLRYRDEPKSLPEIAEELGVSFVVEGSARKAGDDVRLTAQLIDARRDEHLWADHYDRPLTVQNLLSVQSEIAQQVAQAVGVMLSPEEQKRIDQRPTRDLKAYDYYLLGRHHLRQWSLKEIEEGLGYLERAVETDPAFAQGHAGVAYAYSALAVWGQPPEDSWPHARAAAERALALDEAQAEAHNALALEALSHRYDWRGADAGFRRALEYNPSSVDALDWLGATLSGIWGRRDEGMRYSVRARQSDPLSLTVRYHVALLHIWAGELEEALRTLETLGESPSALFMRRHGRAYVLMARGQYEEALEAMKSALEVADQRVEIFTGMLGYLFGRAGLKSEALSQLERLDELASRGIYVSPVSRAHIYAGLGEEDEALTWLEKAYQTRTHWMIWLGNIPWTFEELHSEPRFQDLLERMDFPRLR
jgi:TolB-like protein/Tfp pilus assembly protein PilF